MKQSRKEKEELELEQQRLLKDAASRVKFRGGGSFARCADMGAVAERLRARAAALAPPPPDVTLQQLEALGNEEAAAGAPRGRVAARGVPIALPGGDLADLERFLGGAACAACAVPDGIEGGEEELLLAPPLPRGPDAGADADEEEEEEEGSAGGMLLPVRARGAAADRAGPRAPALLLRLDSTQAELDADEDADWAAEAEEAAEAEKAAAEIASDDEAAAASEGEGADDEAEEAEDEEAEDASEEEDDVPDEKDLAEAKAQMDPEAAARAQAERRERAIAMIREDKAARKAAAQAGDGAVRPTFSHLAFAFL